MAVFEDILNAIFSDPPSRTLGNAIDWGYDNTIGKLTNTQDMFSGEDLRLPISMALPPLLVEDYVIPFAAERLGIAQPNKDNGGNAFSKIFSDIFSSPSQDQKGQKNG